MKNAVFLERSVRRLLVTGNVVPSSSIHVTLMMEALGSPETSVLTRATWRNFPEDGILQEILVLRIATHYARYIICMLTLETGATRCFDNVAHKL
jgi:hypothetical protein